MIRASRNASPQHEPTAPELEHASCICAVNQWLVFVTEHKEDQDQLIRVSREERWDFKPSVSCFNDDATAPIQHPKGDASSYRRCARASSPIWTSFSRRKPFQFQDSRCLASTMAPPHDIFRVDPDPATSPCHRFGVEATLDEVFDAPPLVKHNLKDEAGINETYVCAGCAVP